MQILLNLVIALVVMLFAGYFVTRHHGRWRHFGLGSALGTAAPSIPGSGDDENDSDGSWDDCLGGSGGADSTSAGGDSEP